MQITHQRGIAVGTLVALAGTTLGGLGTPVAQAGANTWRNIAIGAGVLTGYGLLKHKRSLAVVGGVATGLSYLKYRKERKNEKRVAMARSQSYYAYHPAYQPAYRYNSVSPYHYSSAPVRYHPSYSRSYYQPHHVYRHAAYAYHPALHRAAYPYHPALHHAVSATRAIRPQHVAAVVAPAAALAAIPVARHALAAQPATQPVAAAPVAPAAPVAAVAPVAPAAAPASNSILPYALGVLTSLLGVGLGFGLANTKRRQAPVETHYSGFEPPQRRSVS